MSLHVRAFLKSSLREIIGINISLTNLESGEYHASLKLNGEAQSRKKSYEQWNYHILTKPPKLCTNVSKILVLYCAYFMVNITTEIIKRSVPNKKICTILKLGPTLCFAGIVTKLHIRSCRFHLLPAVIPR